MCPAKVLNLLNPVSFISYGFFLYSIVNIFTGVTYISNDNDSWYKTLYYSKNPKFFIFIVSLNTIFALFLFDLVNNIGIIKFFKSIMNVFLKVVINR